ncbi:hypothetical protein A6A08_18735 [Nocardiopsis sp. TSRI0078]|uniref:hypothetical protein n=1 Tax=unclassified Nocardiopsis TaxID=2649073 RepID=UPI00096105F8|nr:hypothetical protein [Nocardiopsis sp. TSRI0078]OKI22974.1 hypothetical protein A6A08_18735 [Nocardiopsis sp. TSRI0078]
MHISGPPGTRDTRIALGDVTTMQVQQDASSAQGREWDWFVHERNTQVRAILDGQGISYAQIRFVPTTTSATRRLRSPNRSPTCHCGPGSSGPI